MGGRWPPGQREAGQARLLVGNAAAVSSAVTKDGQGGMFLALPSRPLKHSLPSGVLFGDSGQAWAPVLLTTIIIEGVITPTSFYFGTGHFSKETEKPGQS